MRIAVCLLVAISFPPLHLLSSAEPAAEGFRDDFVWKYDPAWKILNPNPENVSLTTQPGMLTITTEAGGIWRKGRKNARNIFLIDNPLPNKGDFVITTRMFGFDPDTPYQQAGIICFDDFDNYLKLVLECDETNGGKTIALVPEVDGTDLDNVVLKVNERLEELWLRAIKFDETYVLAASRDGKEYVTFARQKWGNGHPRQFGLIAKNGPGRSTPGIEVNFDEFEMVPLESRPDLKDELNRELFQDKDF